MKFETIAFGRIFFLLAMGAAQGISWYVEAANTTPPWLGTEADPFDTIGAGFFPARLFVAGCPDSSGESAGTPAEKIDQIRIDFAVSLLKGSGIPVIARC
jgi:hypothetical protein